MRHLDLMQSTLNLINAPQIREQFRKIDENIAVLTTLIFPDDAQIASELVKEEYDCRTQWADFLFWQL